MSRLILAKALASDDGVERAPTGEPTAFRIWRAGPNVTDCGTHVFSEKSAELLMAEQATRGNLYSIDVDHMSLNEAAPPEARKAVGWHQLEIRRGARGPELWATQVFWTDAVRAGLCARPPEWRYFSPAYDVKDGEIVSFINTALTNNPATHFVTSLATRRPLDGARRTPPMLTVASIIAMRPDLNRAQREYIQRAAQSPEDAADILRLLPAASAPKLDYAAIVDGLFGDDDAQREAPLRAIKQMTATDRAAFEKMFAATLDDGDDRGTGERTWLNVPTVSARRSAGAIRAARSSPKAAEEIARRFNREVKEPTVRWEGSSLVFPLVSREEAARIVERHRKAGPLPRSATLTPQTVMQAARAARGSSHE